MPDHAALHPVSRRHLDALRGELGIMQHAVGSVADPAHGYCVDDVARALQVDLLHERVLGWAAVERSAHLSLRYLEDAFDASTGRFRNFRDVEGAWIGGPGSNDSVGRAMLALGETIAAAPDPVMLEAAIGLFERALPAAARMTSPRAQASLVLGCAVLARAPAMTGSASAREQALAVESTAVMRRLATGLHAQFLWFAGPGWPWLENELTYENALVPRALIVAGRHLGADVMVKIGLQVLDWLITSQTAPEGHLTPVGNGWWPRLGRRSRFDQQPIEATALLLAAEAAFAATGNPRYRAAMERAYGWFLGRNDLRRRVADPARGACSDALTADGINTNQGAESTLMWLTAAEHIRALRGATRRIADVPTKRAAAAPGMATARAGPATQGAPAAIGLPLATAGR